MVLMDITLTGVDVKTNLSKLKPEYNEEYGILLSANPKSNRYPSIESIGKILFDIDSFTTVAIHVCGMTARENALDGSYDSILRGYNVDRIQVNGKVTEEELREFCVMFYDRTIITQDCPANIDLAKSTYRNHQILLDSSGGKGIVRKEWGVPEHLKDAVYNRKKRIGFAGGLGEDNLADVLKQIPKDLPIKPWVDMETKLRNADDWFDVDVAHRCANIAREHEKHV